jgi:hypothetical protein
MADRLDETGNLLRRRPLGEIIPGHIGPLGMTRMCTGACGLMSWKARACSTS